MQPNAGRKKITSCFLLPPVHSVHTPLNRPRPVDMDSFMLSIGIAPQVVMKFTGHADYKSMKPYIDIAEKAKTDAMDAMEKALGE